VIPQGRRGAFTAGQHPRDRGGKFALKPGHLVPRGRSGKARTDLPKAQHAAFGGGGGGGAATARRPADAVRERLGRVMDALRSFRTSAEAHGTKAAVAAQALIALAALDRLFDRPGAASLHPLASDPAYLADNWSTVHTALKAVTRFAGDAGPTAAHAVMQLLTAYARGELPDDERRLVEAWMRETAWLDAAARGVPGARELAEAAARDAEALIGPDPGVASLPCR
jgi:hypothetical protein